jgi:glycosyltransferase involved in cell wall biosynthesis
VEDVRQDLVLSHAHFQSEAIRSSLQQATDSLPKDCLTIRGGVANITVKRNGLEARGATRLVVACRVVEQKGVHVALQALSLLAHRHGRGKFVLSVAGPAEPEYLNGLMEYARQQQIEPNLVYLGALPRDEVHRLVAQSDVFLFPTVTFEPFGIGLLEAMAIGVPVVGTATGGSAEILRDGINGLVYAPGDAEGCARAIERILADSNLRGCLVKNGRATASELSVDNMMAPIECQLKKVLL